MPSKNILKEKYYPVNPNPPQFVVNVDKINQSISPIISTVSLSFQE